MPPAARKVQHQLAVSQPLVDGRAGSGVQHGRELPEVAHQQEPHVVVQGHAHNVRPQAHVELRDLFHQQPVQALHAGPPHPVSAVFAPAPRFCTVLIRCTTSPRSRSLVTMVRARCVLPVPGSPVSRSDRPARQCATGSATSVQPAALAGGSACMQGGTCLPHSGFVVSSWQNLGLPSGYVLWTSRSELPRHALQHHAVRFHLLDVLWRKAQSSPRS